MKFGLQTFSLATIILIFTFADKLPDSPPSSETMDSKIEITSLKKPAPIAPTEPKMMPFLPSEKLPEINAEIATVFLFNQSKLLVEYNTTKRHPMASITKLITSIVAADIIGFQKQVELTDEDIEQEGTMGDFKSGEAYTIGDLVKAMLITSSNDAAFAIARTYGYNIFIKAMNEKIKEIGMKNTFVNDPAGLSQLNQGTGEDLEILAKYLIKKYPHLLGLSREKETTITEVISSKKRVIKNINKFAGNADFLGGKTGYTDEAKGNLLSVFNYNGNKILIIVLGADDRFSETEKLYDWTKKILAL